MAEMKIEQPQGRPDADTEEWHRLGECRQHAQLHCNVIHTAEKSRVSNAGFRKIDPCKKREHSALPARPFDALRTLEMPRTLEFISEPAANSATRQNGLLAHTS